MGNNKQVANYFNKELIRCIKTEENGETTVKYLSPYVVKSEFLFERTGFKPDDPNLNEKLGIKDETQPAANQDVSNTATVSADIPDLTGIKQSDTASVLIKQFTEDNGTPKKKRKRITKIKAHAD